MFSILDIMSDIRNIHKVPCDIKLIFYSEMIGGIKIDKVAIYHIEHREEVEKAKDLEYCPHCIVLYKSQYNTLFKPLFDNISRLNKEVTDLQNKLDI